MTRYAIRRTDGEYLKLAQQDGALVLAWVLHASSADTWPTMTEATLAAMDPQGANLAASPHHWTIEPVEGPHEDKRPPTRQERLEAYNRKLTRLERLQGLADSGIDTWEEYRGEK